MYSLHPEVIDPVLSIYDKTDSIVSVKNMIVPFQPQLSTASYPNAGDRPPEFLCGAVLQASPPSPKLNRV
jgi:hypothetical protein